jgi:hypothetical protein
MSKTREQQIKDMAAELRTIIGEATPSRRGQFFEGYDQQVDDRTEEIAERLLDAAQRPQPWPTNESVSALSHELREHRWVPLCCTTGHTLNTGDAHETDGWSTGGLPEALRAALLADPIVRAAIEWHEWIRQQRPSGPLPMGTKGLWDAVSATGLTILDLPHPRHA